MEEGVREALLRELASRDDELIAFLGELIATPSPNPPGDEQAVVRLLSDALRAFGYRDLEIIASEPARPNLLARIGPKGGRSLALSGHVDTKPPGDVREWLTPPYEPTVVDGRLFGLGAADMKGGVAAMIFAGRALAAVDALEGELRLVLTADEEAGAAHGATYLVDRIETSDGILVGEPTGVNHPWDYLAVASRGVACFRIRVRGTQMHSSLTDRLPSVNASVKLAGVLTKFAKCFRATVPEGSVWSVTVNPGVTLSGGVFYGVCPGEAEFGVDVRTLPGMTLAGLQDDVQAFLDVLRAEDPELEVEALWDPANAWFPPSSVDPHHRLVAAARAAASAILNDPIPDGLFPGGTEGAIWATRGMPVLPALGPGRLSDAHRPNESVGIDEVLAAARIYALTSLDFLRSGSQQD